MFGSDDVFQFRLGRAWAARVIRLKLVDQWLWLLPRKGGWA
jgi:hypothetical protein